MIQLTYDLAKSLLNTSRERTAQTVEGQELYIGVGDTAYLDSESARELLSDDEYEATTSVNPVFRHVDDETLFHLLRRTDFFLVGEDSEDLQ